MVLVSEDLAKKEGKEGLDRRNLLDVTLEHLVILVRKLGVKVRMVRGF